MIKINDELKKILEEHSLPETFAIKLGDLLTETVEKKLNDYKEELNENINLSNNIIKEQNDTINEYRISIENIEKENEVLKETIANTENKIITLEENFATLEMEKEQILSTVELYSDYVNEEYMKVINETKTDEDIQKIIEEQSDKYQEYVNNYINEKAEEYDLYIENFIKEQSDEYQQYVDNYIEEERNKIVDKIDSYLDVVIEKHIQENEVPYVNLKENNKLRKALEIIREAFESVDIQINENKTLKKCENTLTEAKKLNSYLIEQNKTLKENIETLNKKLIFESKTKDLTLMDKLKIEEMIKNNPMLHENDADNYSKDLSNLISSMFDTETHEIINETKSNKVDGKVFDLDDSIINKMTRNIDDLRKNHLMNEYLKQI